MDGARGLSLALVIAGMGCGPAFAQALDDTAFEQQGKASYYHNRFEGRRTANGEVLDQDKFTAASTSLPLGTRVTVINQENGRSVDVRVNERGPHVRGRVIDVTEAAAEKLDMKQDGITKVKVVARPSAQPNERLKAKVRQKVAAKKAVQQQQTKKPVAVHRVAQN